MAVAFFDIDNTLTGRNPQTGFGDASTPRVREALRRFSATGNVALFCTGRAPMGIPEDLRSLPFRGAVCFDGALALLDGRAVYERPVEPALVERCAAEAMRLGINLLLSGMEGRALLGNASGFDWRATEVHSLTELREVLPTLSVYKMAFRTNDWRRYEASEALRRELTHYQSAVDYHELVALGVGKDVAARAVLEALRAKGEPAGPVYAFGDSANDLPVFRVADVRVAMGNATPEVRAAADYVTDDVAHDGVATALVHFGLV